MNLVIFPSAKIVTKDLQGVGKLPAIVYPIDQRRMIDLFLDFYMGEDSRIDAFEIVTFEAHEQVEKRIKKKNNKRINIHRLDCLKDLGYSILYGMNQYDLKSDDRLIINFADVIVSEPIGQQILDRCYYAKEDISSKWTYFNSSNGKINDYYDKPENTEAIDTNNILIGVFHIAHPLDLRNLLKMAIAEKGKIENRESLWVALKKYSQMHPFEMKCVDEWFDIGHIDKYYDMQMAIKSRTFNHIMIDRSRGILTKTSDDKEKFIGEIQWYLKLPTDIEYVRPRIFSYSMDYERPFVSMEYYSYHTLHELFLYGELTNEQWCNIFRRIRFILNDFSRYTVKSGDIKKAVEDIYLHKTLDRISSMKQNNNFIDFDTPIMINGTQYYSLTMISGLLPEVIKKNLYDIDCFTVIHGDLCFSNILIDPNYSFIKVIDPRGKFGKFDIYGDQRYEYAKLMHSIDGKYDYIIKDMFTLEYRGNNIKYEILFGHEIDILKCFFEIFQEEMDKEYGQIKLIEALLFFSMVPLHQESREQQIVMLATAIKLLNEVIDIRLEEP